MNIFACFLATAYNKFVKDGWWWHYNRKWNDMTVGNMREALFGSQLEKLKHIQPWTLEYD